MKRLYFSILFLTKLVACVLSSVNPVIYVDPDNGTVDPNCWTGGISLPCKNFHLARKGAELFKARVVQVPSKVFNHDQYPESLTCQQAWTYLDNGTCRCGTTYHRSVKCSIIITVSSLLRNACA